MQPKDDPRFAEVEHAVHWMLRFPSGVLADCGAAYDDQTTKRYRVLAQRGWLELDPATDYYRHNMNVERKTETDEPLREDRPISERDPFALMLDHMPECVQRNREPRTPARRARATSGASSTSTRPHAPAARSACSPRSGVARACGRVRDGATIVAQWSTRTGQRKLWGRGREGWRSRCRRTRWRSRSSATAADRT